MADRWVALQEWLEKVEQTLADWEHVHTEAKALL